MGQSFVIRGGVPLQGKIAVSGSKNAALPIICAALLTREKTLLRNVPEIEDVNLLCKILESMGVTTVRKGNRLTIDPKNMKANEIDREYTAQMRASILLLGPLLGRFRRVKLGFPGGCVIGKRSVRSHLNALEDMGYRIINSIDTLHLTGRPKSGKVVMNDLSVTATENAVMAAVLGNKEITIRVCATEPHVQDMCRFLRKMGADIKGIGSHTLRIKGVRKLKGVRHKITSDYLEAGTLAIAAAITRGNVWIENFNPDHLDALWKKFAAIGVRFKIHKNAVHVYRQPRLWKPVSKLDTRTFPGFPTDLQSPMGVLLTQCSGVSKIFETMFEGRLNYLLELEKMGARVEVYNPHQALVVGLNKLKGVTVSSYDLRAGAAMVLAGLIAKGTTTVTDIVYIDRGYERIDEKLASLGAKIQRVQAEKE